MKVNCHLTAKKNIGIVLCKAAQYGEGSFEAYKSAHNAFIGTLSATANAMVAVISPILELDKIVLDTFVRPPLDATIKTLETATQTVKIPLRIMTSLNGSGECASYNGKLARGAQAVVDFNTKDFNKLQNMVDGLDEWLGDREELIKDIQDLADKISDMQVQMAYDEFVEKVCQKTSQS